MKLCLIKENVEDVPNSDVADINFDQLKKRSPLFPRSTFDNHFTIKLLEVNHFCRIMDVHFYNNVTFK